MNHFVPKEHLSFNKYFYFTLIWVLVFSHLWHMVLEASDNSQPNLIWQSIHILENRIDYSFLKFVANSVQIRLILSFDTLKHLKGIKDFEYEYKGLCHDELGRLISPL